MPAAPPVVLAREMVDTHVLVYAAASASPRHKQRPECVASAALVTRLKTVRVSAIAWIEFQRYAPAGEAEALAKLGIRLQVESADARVAQRAAELLAQHRRKEKVCERCLNSDQTHPCAKCGRNISAQQRLADAMILATAECLGDVDALYSYDGGIASMADGSRCQVLNPPNPHGPLFDPDRNPTIEKK